MPKFRKKPVVIEAIQILAGDGIDPPFLEEGAEYRSHPLVGLEIKTLENWLSVMNGDWIVKGVAGEFYPVKPEIFEATYDPMEEEEDPMAKHGHAPADPTAGNEVNPPQSRRYESEDG